MGFDLSFDFLYTLRSLLWQGPMIVLLASTGLFLTWRLGGVQMRLLPLACRSLFSPPADESTVGEMSHFQALMTAMASAIGTGSIAGVATALSIGGYGALFWMWVTALLGMATAYSETLLSVKYRSVGANGRILGGPMYVLQRGLKSPFLAHTFAIFGSLAAFGIGSSVQVNSVAGAAKSMYGIEPWVTGCVLIILTAWVLAGGVRLIGRILAIVIPVMAFCYVCFGCGILFMHLDGILPALSKILNSAFNGQAAFGGFAGSSVMMGLQIGVARGVFTNEAGMGSTAIAASAARTDEPARQGLISMLGVFFSTMVVCTMTGLVLIVTDTVGALDAGGSLVNGAPLVIQAFESVYSFGGHIVTIGLFFFAYSTTIAWAYYGERCVGFFGRRHIVTAYRVLFVLLIFPGAILGIDVVWALADSMNALMAIPNLLGVLALSGVVVEETRRFAALQRHTEVTAT